MRSPLLLPLTLLSLLLPGCGDGDLLTTLHPGLKDVEGKQREAKRRLDALGEPVIGQTVPQFGFMTIPHFGFTDDGNKKDYPTRWVQVELRKSQPIDQVALVPVQDPQSMERASFRFPTRFRVEISDDNDVGANPTLIADFTNRDFPDPGLTPVVIPAPGKQGRYVRVTVLEPVVYALAELMVMSGNRNLAVGTKVWSVDSATSPPRWDSFNLVDGQTPLGPPILRESLPYDGLFAGPPPDEASPVWMTLDLGRELPIEEVRLYPIHGQLGVDTPGYGFPLLFRVELSNESEFKSATTIFETDRDFPNPGNNAVTLPAQEQRGRYLRVLLLKSSVIRKRFCLSEIEVYSGGINVARQAKVDSTPDQNTARKSWPKSLLVDGCSSYGRILELPEWLHNWTQRRDLKAELARLDIEHDDLMVGAKQRLWWLLAGLGTLFVVGVGGVALNARRIRERDLQQFRRKLAQDLHDEIGSNLAAIGVYSEAAAGYAVPVGPDYWWKIFQIAHEATDAMRETLWVAGGNEEVGIDVMKHLQLVATRMLPGRNVQWLSIVEDFPKNWTSFARKEVFLFFKETLANVVRHSRATSIDLSARLVDGWFELEIKDNGQGFSATAPGRGIGLYSLKERATRLGGTVKIDTAPGKGTDVLLRVRIDGVACRLRR